MGKKFELQGRFEIQKLKERNWNLGRYGIRRKENKIEMLGKIENMDTKGKNKELERKASGNI